MSDNVGTVAGDEPRKTTKPQTVIVELTAEAREYLTTTRGLSVETLQAFRVGCTTRGNIAIPFFDEKDVRRLVKFRHAKGGLLELGDKKLKTYIEPGGKQILLGSHMAHPAEGPLVICFGDYDAMSIYQDGVPNAVSLPVGDKGLQFLDLQWDFLEGFSEIVLWPDKDNYPNEKARMKAAEKLDELAQRLGKHRVKIVEVKKLPDLAKDANDLLVKYGAGSCQKAIDAAVWYPEQNLVAVADHQEEEFTPGRKTGFHFLDVNTGGFGKGHLILIGGDNGAGKTTIALKLIAESVNQKSPTLYWSGEQRVGRIRYWFDRIAAGPENLKKVIARETGFKLYFPTEETLPFIRDWYREQFFQFNDFFTDAPKFFEVAELAIRRYGVKTIVIDNLMAFTGGEGDNYFQAQGDFAQSCKMFAEKWGVVVILIVHNRKRQGKPSMTMEISTKDDIEGSKKVTNWADTILQMDRIPKHLKELEEWEGIDGVIGLVKCRETGLLGEVKTVIDPVSNRIIEYGERDMIGANYGWYAAFKGESLFAGQPTIT